MTAPTLDSQSLGNVQNISFTKSGDIDPSTLPGSDSDSTITYDYGGVVRNMTVSGIFTGATTAAVKTLVDAISNIIDGDQADSVDFISDQLGTIKVKIVNYNVTWEIPSNRARYSLSLVEGE